MQKGELDRDRRWELTRLHARKVAAALGRGRVKYNGHVGDKRLNPDGFPWRLNEAYDRMLESDLEASLFVMLLRARRVEEYPSQLMPLFDRWFIQHPTLRLIDQLQKTTRITRGKLIKIATDAFNGGEIDVPFVDEQLPATGLRESTHRFLQNEPDIDEVIRLIERGVLYFFKQVAEAQVEIPTVALSEEPQDRSLFGTEARDLAMGLQVASDQIFELACEHLARRVPTGQEPGWATASMIDLGCARLPCAAQAVLERCDRAQTILSEHRERLIRVQQVDGSALPGLPVDRRIRLQAALAVVADTLRLEAVPLVHDRHYQKHKRYLREITALLRRRDLRLFHEPEDPGEEQQP